MSRRAVRDARAARLLVCGMLGLLGVAERSPARAASEASDGATIQDVLRGPSAPSADELLQLVERILPLIASLRGLTLKEPVAQRIVDQATIRQLVEQAIARRGSSAELANTGKALIAFGFLPDGFQLEEYLLRLYTGQLAGLYDPETRTLYLANWIPAMLQEATVAHELVHALQDQHVGLRRYLEAVRGRSEEALARQAVVEGEAMAVMLDYQLRDQQLSFTSLGDVASRTELLLGALAATAGASASGQTYLEELMLFPYFHGLAFLQAVRRQHPWSWVARLYDDPPRSTEQVLHPEKYLVRRDEPAAVSLASVGELLGGAWELIDADRVGEFATHSLIRRHVDSQTASLASEGWGGDAYHVYEEGASGRLALVWVSVWDSARDAQEFQAAYNQLLSAKYRQEEPSAQIAGRWTTERGAAHVERRDTTVVVVEGVPLELADAVVARVWTGQFPSASEAVTAAPAQGPTEPSRLGASEFAGRGQALLDRFPLQMDEALLLEAVGYFKKALRVDETDLAACLGLAEALARLGTLGEGTDDPDTARYWLARATSLRPDHPDVLQVTALVAWHRGRYAEAEAAAREAIRREPASGRLYFRLGQILGDNARHNDQEQAIATLQTALALEPTPRGQWRILIELSRIYNGLGRREEELAAERRAVELEPTAWWGWHNYVDTLLHFGRHDEAIAAAQRALTLRDYAWTRSHLVEAYLRKGMAAEAKAQLELIQAAEVLAYLASVFREAREAEQALALARKAVTLDPADPYHYQQLGLAWEALGESQRAIDAFTQATCLSPRGPRDRDNVSIAYYRWAGILAFDRQRYAEALPLYQRALSANPSNAWVYYGLGTCYHQLGRFSEARQAWKRFLEFQPSGEWADRVRQKLASLDGA